MAKSIQTRCTCNEPESCILSGCKWLKTRWSHTLSFSPTQSNAHDLVLASLKDGKLFVFLSESPIPDSGTVMNLVLSVETSCPECVRIAPLKHTRPILVLCKACDGTGLCVCAKKEIDAENKHNASFETSLCRECFGFQVKESTLLCKSCFGSRKTTEQKSVSITLFPTQPDQFTADQGTVSFGLVPVSSTQVYCLAYLFKKQNRLAQHCMERASLVARIH